MTDLRDAKARLRVLLHYSQGDLRRSLVNSLAWSDINLVLADALKLTWKDGVEELLEDKSRIDAVTKLLEGVREYLKHSTGVSTIEKDLTSALTLLRDIRDEVT